MKRRTLPHGVTDQISCNAVLCRYGEIALKGANRRRFEDQFVEGALRVAGVEGLRHSRDRGRVLLHLAKFANFTPETTQQLIERLPRAFGLESFSPGVRTESKVEAIEQAVWQLFPPAYDMAVAQQNKPLTYRMRARRSDKKFPLSSKELEIRIGDQILAKYPELKLDLVNADLSIWLEVRDSWSFVFVEHFAGPGGLPAGSSGRALALLSGGIDSPVACYQTMKRGCSLDFLTFHSHPYTPPESLQKVGRLVNHLNQYQRRGRYFACNLVEAQKAVRDNCSERFRTILYRRLMMRIAERIATDLKLQALVTGDSVGQVASQTLQNMNVIDRATSLLVLRPLVGTDKQEAVDIARRIGTFTVSEEECPDSCTVFSPRSPATKAPLGRLLHEEDSLAVAELVEQSLAAVTVIDPESFDEITYADFLAERSAQ